MAAQARTPAAGKPDRTALQARLRHLGSQWRAAAEGAFNGLAQSPERYIAAGRLVAAWLDRLRALPPVPAAGAHASGSGYPDERDDEAAVAALLAAWDARASRTADSETASLPVTSAEREALIATAFAIRYTEVADWLVLRQRRRTMAGAAGSPGKWVILDEAGDANGDPFIAYRRIEVDPVTGHGVLVETRPDDSFTRAIHEVHLIRVDPLTGELECDSAETSWEFKSASEREDHVATLRPGAARTTGQPAN